MTQELHASHHPHPLSHANFAIPTTAENVHDLFVNNQPHSLAPENACTQDSTNQVAEVEDYYRHVLRNLVEIGADLARMIQQEAHEAQAARLADATVSAAKSTVDFAGPFDLIARGIRRTILLDHKLAEPKKPPSPHQRTAARKRIIREVEDAIQSNAPDEQAETLHAELLERLDSPELDDELATRSVAEIVTDICRDFGIAALPGPHPWKRRMPIHIAILSARAAECAGAPPSEKLLALLANAPPPPPRPPGHSPIAGIDLSKVSDEDLDNMINRLGLLRES
jgi:hypothetical protein